MPGKPATPKKEASTPSTTDPVAKAGDYKSIAAQYAKAKALKEKEDAAAAVKKAGGVGKVKGRALERSSAKAPITDGERINKRKEGVFKKTWNSSLGFFFWLL
jgi:hypothetical protein